MYFYAYFFKMLSRQSTHEASEGTSVTSCIQNCHRCPAGRPGYSLIPSLNAESCLREKRVTGVFSAAGHYTDSMPFNSARRACKSIPASCLLFPRNASSQAAALSWLLVLSWHPECCGLTPSGREQDSRNQRCSQATLF